MNKLTSIQQMRDSKRADVRMRQQHCSQTGLNCSISSNQLAAVLRQNGEHEDFCQIHLFRTNFSSSEREEEEEKAEK